MHLNFYYVCRSFKRLLRLYYKKPQNNSRNNKRFQYIEEFVMHRGDSILLIIYVINSEIIFQF